MLLMKSRNERERAGGAVEIGQTARRVVGMKGICLIGVICGRNINSVRGVVLQIEPIAFDEAPHSYESLSKS
ncbi:hypothetical protein [Pontiella sp.]|uniref:hypothetical protein n=2 Tax=Pontiella sp. TaxID=2837462 RepID=UPI0035615E7E